jgi:hypothetical protein
MWKDTLLISLRILVGDENRERYSDESLEYNLGIAAQFVLMDIKGVKDYEITLPFNIEPEPLQDRNFLLLISLKAACLIINSEVRSYMVDGGGKRITMKDGMSEITIDNTGTLNMTKNLASEICLKYDDALFQFNIDESGKRGVVISGPNTINNTINKAYNLIYDNRSQE